MPAPDLLVVRVDRRHGRHLQQLQEARLGTVAEAREDLEPLGSHAGLQVSNPPHVGPGDGAADILAVGVQRLHALHRVGCQRGAQLTALQELIDRTVEIVEELPVEEPGPAERPARSGDLLRAQAARPELAAERWRQQHHAAEALHLLEALHGDRAPLVVLVVRRRVLVLLHLLPAVAGLLLVVRVVVGVHPCELLGFLLWRPGRRLRAPSFPGRRRTGRASGTAAAGTRCAAATAMVVILAVEEATEILIVVRRGAPHWRLSFSAADMHPAAACGPKATLRRLGGAEDGTPPETA
mmetsp:Transcript_123423/g.308390  ORF Transcript_123423/g.308390 Transcript_123423/m.308390 type:complete len:296 (-) Transcript_123423:2-889(-)